MAGINLLAEISNAETSGLELHSQEILFKPTCLNGGTEELEFILLILGKYKVDIQTAGSIALLIQASLPTLLFANQKSFLTLIGGKQYCLN